MYQLEIPKAAEKNIPREFYLVSKTKTVHRYYTPTIEKILPLLQDAKEKKEEALRNVLKETFLQFDAHYSTWKKCIKCIAGKSY